MLYSLHVKNLALIDEQEIEFGKGLNILTGETGAGKSVVIGSVNLALGAKADKDLIRKGAEYALIEMSFGISNAKQLEDIEKTGFMVDEDNTLIIQRKILPNRSVCKVNGETVTAKQLRELAEKLINIHGQNDQQSLLHRQKQMEILDAFCGSKLMKLKETLRNETAELGRLEKELSSTDMDEKTRLREQELAEFELNEIEEASLVEGEDEQLESDYRRMSNSRRISEAIGNARELIGGEESGVSDGISRALREVNSVSSYDTELSDIISQLNDLDSLTSDLIRSIDDHMTDMEFDDSDFSRIEYRLNQINRLKDKYGGSITEILKYRDERSQQLEKLSNLDAHRQQLTALIHDKQRKALELCRAVSNMRKEKSQILSQQLRTALLELNFNEVKFEVDVKPDEEKISSNGFDEVVFMISTNHGEELRPLDEVASGGELSRIMLALKTVFADEDDIDTLIFDEIDSGISGKTAWKVSEKLGLLAEKRQVVCITHLPQIAAMADNHFLIEKGLENDRTVTHIQKLDEKRSIDELARMLGGETITEAVLQNANEMRIMAKKRKGI